MNTIKSIVLINNKAQTRLIIRLAVTSAKAQSVYKILVAGCFSYYSSESYCQRTVLRHFV